MELSSSLDLITGKAISVLENEASLLTEIGAEIDEVKLELKAIRAFLEDADRRSGAVPLSETDKQWVANVRDIAYEVEDVVDEFMYHFNKQQPWRGKPYRFFLKLIHFPKDLLVKHQVAVKLQGINKRIKSIADRSQRYRVSSSDSRKSDKQIRGEYYRNNWVKNLSISSLFFKDDDLVGIDKAQNELLGWLMYQELQRTVISVVGMGELFKSITKELNNGAKAKIKLVDSMEYQDLVEALLNFLQPRRYLIVIDDVWSTNLWQDISIALPANMKGTGSCSLHKAFISNTGQCPPYLESSATKLVEKCQGLPLAIVALGGLMASKNSIADWSEVYNNLNRELSENDAYFERLKRNRLIRLWMAEGYVEQMKETIPEVFAERYLTELICRGLLQVVSRNGSGRPKAFKMHDILREFAVPISKSIKFVVKSDGMEELEDNGNRRWSIEAKGKEMKGASGTALPRVRSLFVFAVDETSKSSFNRLPSGFKLMRVLDLEDTPINELPDESVNLFNLRYLNLSRTQVKGLPRSIGKLYNLQSLVMKWTQIKELPAGILKLKNLQYLQHLFAYEGERLDFLEGFQKLKSMRSGTVTSGDKASGELDVEKNTIDNKRKKAIEDKVVNASTVERKATLLEIADYPEDELSKGTWPPQKRRIVRSVVFDEASSWWSPQRIEFSEPHDLEEVSKDNKECEAIASDPSEEIDRSTSKDKSPWKMGIHQSTSEELRLSQIEVDELAQELRRSTSAFKLVLDIWLAMPPQCLWSALPPGFIWSVLPPNWSSAIGVLGPSDFQHIYWFWFLDLDKYYLPIAITIISVLGCSAGDRFLEYVDMKYLGLPLGARRNLVASWEPVIKKLSSKLANWKSSLLSFGGRLTLVKAVLSALPMYYMLLFRSSDGLYSPKSLKSLVVPTSNSSVNWDKIAWIGLAPPKAEAFIWLLLHGRVPVKIDLAERGVLLLSDTSCPFCSVASETVEHIFFSCNFSWGIWTVIGKLWRLSLALHQNPMEFLLQWPHLCSKLESDLMWSLMPFAIACQSIGIALIFGPHFFGSIKCLSEGLFDTKNCSIGCLVPPLIGFLKFNVDGACDKSGNCGVGVLRNHEGVILLEFSRNIGTGSSLSTEILAVKYALDHFINLEWGPKSRLIIESDSKVVVDCILCPSSSHLTFARLVQGLNHFFANGRWIIRHINQAQNILAGNLAKKVSADLGINIGEV
ncbi:hypothetical protein V6N12_036600 [Hibiscus sabdariffa]|uniref:RNase H type-1 domain-containing protein n=1 Tax=Hibiscus sabdariffa TaxID=183260 RepID=A0ABR2ER27_9ROSI